MTFALLVALLCWVRLPILAAPFSAPEGPGCIARGGSPPLEMRSQPDDRPERGEGPPPRPGRDSLGGLTDQGRRTAPGYAPGPLRGKSDLRLRFRLVKILNVVVRGAKIEWGTLVCLGQDSAIDGVSLAELPAYAAALSTRHANEPIAATFRQLWADPDSYRGRSVQVSGRVARVFRAPATGAIPARVEIWLATGSGDLICTVLPDEPSATTIAREGQTIVVAGTSLGPVRYASGDVARLAPLIVGPGPAVRGDDEPRSHGAADWSASAWLLAAIGAVAVAGLLVRAHSRRPPRPRPEPPDDVEFLS
jgi:hypothetical protein